MKFILSVLFLLNLGCSGFKQSDLPAFGGDEDGQQIINVDYQLSIKNGPYEGRLVADHIRNSSIKILIPVDVNSHVPVGSFSFAQWSISGVVKQDQANFKTLEVNVPINHVAQGVNAPSVATLPNGDALDFIESGEAQHVVIPLDSSGRVNVHLYFSPPYHLGVFIQTPFDLASANKYSVSLVNGLMPMGFFSTHPHRPPLNGGSFVFISLPR